MFVSLTHEVLAFTHDAHGNVTSRYSTKLTYATFMCSNDAGTVRLGVTAVLALLGLLAAVLAALMQ